MSKHIDILGWLYIGFSTLGLLGALFAFMVLTGAGWLSGDAEAALITSGVGMLIAAFLLLVSLPGIIGGVGLLKRKGWARPLVLVLGFLNLLNFPLGTLLGAYTLWVLFREGSARQFGAQSAL